MLLKNFNFKTLHIAVSSTINNKKVVYLDIPGVKTIIVQTISVLLLVLNYYLQF